MSASPQNVSPELSKTAAGRAPSVGPVPRKAVAGHEALQALLAFSALHEQVRKRRARAKGAIGSAPREEIWELEQFVLDEVLQLVAERALSITGADGVAIGLAEGNSIVCRAAVGRIAPDRGAELNPNSGFSGACLSSGQIIRCDDSEQDSRVDKEACRRLGTRSMVAVPLSARENVVGLLEAFSTEPFGFNDSDVRSLGLLAELVLSALKPEEEDRLAEIAQRVVVAPARAESAEATSAKVNEQQSFARSATLGATTALVVPTEPIALPLASLFKDDRTPPRRLRNPLIAACVLIAAGVLVAPLLKAHLQRKPEAEDVSESSQGTIASLPLSVFPAMRAVADEKSKNSELETAAPAATSNVAGRSAEGMRNSESIPAVNGIRHWSSADSSTVAIDLQSQAQYEAHRLSSPDRIYFDLEDTAMAPGLRNRTIEINDIFLSRVRMAQPKPGVTRVVLETKGTAQFSVSLLSHPYRLQVEVRATAATPKDSGANPGTAKAAEDVMGSAGPAKVEAERSAPELARTSPKGFSPTGVAKFRIALDAGHGGWDLGTVGRKGLLEKDLVLDIVHRLGQLVRRRLGADIVYTRQDDNYVSLEQRTEVANQAQADLFISVHANYSDSPSARGVETYYTNTYSARSRNTELQPSSPALQNESWANVDLHEKVQEGRRFAASIQRSLYSSLAAKSSGIRDRGVKEASYVVLTGTAMPAVLAEVSFVSSPQDESQLQGAAYRQQIAEALYQGIARYASQAHHVKMASASTNLALH